MDAGLQSSQSPSLEGWGTHATNVAARALARPLNRQGAKDAKNSQEIVCSLTLAPRTGPVGHPKKGTMTSELADTRTRRSREDEVLSGFSLSLLIAIVCVFLDGWPILFVAPVVLVPVVWLLPWWRKRRPPRALVTPGKILTLLAAIFWLASVSLSITLKVSGSEAWTFGRGQIEHIRYRGSAPFANARDVTIRLDSPVRVPVHMLGSLFGDISVGDGRGFTSRSRHWGTFAPLVCVLAPTWLLHRLRKARIPPGHCAHCEYDLTGNVSGRCPECGEPFEPQKRNDDEPENGRGASSSGRDIK